MTNDIIEIRNAISYDIISAMGDEGLGALLTVDDLLACLDPREVTEEEINRGLAKLQEAFRRLESNE